MAERLPHWTHLKRSYRDGGAGGVARCAQSLALADSTLSCPGPSLVLFLAPLSPLLFLLPSPSPSRARGQGGEAIKFG